MTKILKKANGKLNVEGPVLTVVMDGVGIAPDNAGNAVKLAYTPTLDMLAANYPMLKLKAHGTAVGLPSDDDMGNSEVGHNALGSGQVFAQGAKLVSQSIESGKMFASDTWKEVVANVKNNNSTLHFLGLFSDGNVHSHIDHLKAMMTEAKKEGVKKVRVHILLDGRDVGETSALDYVRPFEEFMNSLRSSDFDVMIASGGGRMNITMDRYEANWAMVEKGWKTHVLGEGRQFASAEEAITTYRKELKVIDQDLPPFVIAKNGKPVGTIEDGDSVVFYNFRGDRAIEISLAFDSENFDKFDRVRFPKVVYAGMLEYDGDRHIPHKYLVNPPEITDKLIECLESGKYKYLRVNFPNGDMVGHTGNLAATECAMEALDLQLKRIIDVVDKLKGVALITADHGNADEMYEVDKKGALKTDKNGKYKAKTSHTLNPVPCFIYDNYYRDAYTVKADEGKFGLSDVAATMVNFMGYEAPEMWDQSLIEIKK